MLLDGHDGADSLIAAVPRHAVTERIAGRMARRCRGTGIEIALVSDDGAVARWAITLPRSANRSSWFGVASRSERKGPDCGGAGLVSDGFIVEHRRG